MWVIRRQLKRRYVLAFFQKLPQCLVGIEACAVVDNLKVLDPKRPIREADISRPRR
jgi:hypothetical protein